MNNYKGLKHVMDYCLVLDREHSPFSVANMNFGSSLYHLTSCRDCQKWWNCILSCHVLAEVERPPSRLVSSPDFAGAHSWVEGGEVSMPRFNKDFDFDKLEPWRRELAHWKFPQFEQPHSLLRCRWWRRISATGWVNQAMIDRDGLSWLLKLILGA